MKTEVKKVPKSMVEIKVELAGEELRPYVEMTIADAVKKAKIKGFRPGKAPREKVIEEVGQFNIYQEAAISAIKEVYPKLVADNKIGAIGEPKIDITKLAPGEALEFKIEIAVLPEVKLGDYRKVREKRNNVEIKNEAIEEELKKIQKSRAALVTVKRAAQKGDRVEVNFSARVGGVKLEGGESKNHPLVIGEGMFAPGFEDNLIGLKEGESKKFNLVFSADYHKKDLAGKPADFEVQMVLVQEQILPEINDDFAKNLGKFTDLSNLKSNLKEGLAKEEEEKESQRIRIKAIEEVVANSVMEVPEILTHHEVHKMLDEFASNVENMGLKFETYLGKIEKSEEDLEKEWMPEAEKRVKINLVIRAIAEKEKIAVTDEEVEEEANKALAAFGDIEEAKKKFGIPRLMEYAKGVIINKKVFDLLEKIAAKN